MQQSRSKSPTGRSSSRDSRKTEKADKSWDYTLHSRNLDTTAGIAIARWGTAFVEAQYLAEYPLIACAIVKRGGNGGTGITRLAKLE
jgi:hypothetical protein